MNLKLRYTGGLGPRLRAEVPGSKSYAARALMLNAYNHQSAPARTLSNLPLCDDILNLARAINEIDLSRSVDVGESGTALRLLTAYAASRPGTEVEICGTERLLSRPMKPLLEALAALGAEVTHEPGKPVRIRGRRLSPGPVEIDGSVSSQFLTALRLMDPRLQLDVRGGMVSTPYFRITEEICREWAATPPSEGFEIPTDWSGAAFMCELAAVAPDIQEVAVASLRSPVGSLQSDSAMAFTPGVGYRAENGTGILAKAAGPEATEHFTFNLRECPDLAPALAASLAGQGIPFTLTGTARLRDKESDRVESIVRGLDAYGYDCFVEENRFGWTGTRREFGEVRIDSCRDHRIAMAFSVLAASVPGREVEVQGAECVNKSFPGFYRQLRSLGFEIWKVH